MVAVTSKEIFGVLDRRSLMGGGHTWSCDCNNLKYIAGNINMDCGITG